MYLTSKFKPKIGKEILFWYDDMFHIGYLVSDDGSDKPRKWNWYSYIKNYENIDELIEFWCDLPEEPKKN